MSGIDHTKINRMLLSSLRHLSIALDSHEHGETRDVSSHAESAIIQLASILTIVKEIGGVDGGSATRSLNHLKGVGMISAQGTGQS